MTRACLVALLVDFNYDTEPLTGHYPARLGLPLLKESRLIHLGKLAFQQLYWHSLLPGRDLPGIRAAMPRRGKMDLPAGAQAEAARTAEKEAAGQPCRTGPRSRPLCAAQARPAISGPQAHARKLGFERYFLWKARHGYAQLPETSRSG